MQKGQILKRKSHEGKRKILEIIGDLYFMSVFNNHDAFGDIYTKQDIEKYFELPEEEWEPKNGKMYWGITGSGEIIESCWCNDKSDNDRKSLGNCFRTKEQAEEALEKIKKVLKG